MKLLLIDTETNDLQNADIIDIACLSYDTEYGITQVISSLVPSIKDNKSYQINKIKPEATQKIENSEAILRMIKQMIADTDYCVAYNADFDKPLVEALLGISKPWICAMKDMSIPYRGQTQKYTSLVNLALSYDVPVCFNHHALDDVLIMARLFDKLDIENLIENALKRQTSPSIKIIAHISYNKRNKAKNKGFLFDRDKKQWYKLIKEIDLSELQPTLDFKCEIVREND